MADISQHGDANKALRKIPIYTGLTPPPDPKQEEATKRKGLEAINEFKGTLDCKE